MKKNVARKLELPSLRLYPRTFSLALVADLLGPRNETAEVSGQFGSDIFRHEFTANDAAQVGRWFTQLSEVLATGVLATKATSKQ